MKKLILFLLIIISCYVTNAQWEDCNNGLSGNVTALVLSGDNIIAGVYGSGVYISNDNGNSWVSQNTGLTNLFISTLAVKDNYIFAGNYSGVFLSEDNGNNWIKKIMESQTHQYILLLL